MEDGGPGSESEGEGESDSDSEGESGGQSESECKRDGKTSTGGESAPADDMAANRRGWRKGKMRLQAAA
jgi:hypothetical protein